jgi:hypothetical protein
MKIYLLQDKPMASTTVDSLRTFRNDNPFHLKRLVLSRKRLWLSSRQAQAIDTKCTASISDDRTLSHLQIWTLQRCLIIVKSTCQNTRIQAANVRFPLKYTWYWSRSNVPKEKLGRLAMKK